MADKEWGLAVQLRGRSFARNLETYKMLTRLKPPKEAFDETGKGIVSIPITASVVWQFFSPQLLIVETNTIS